MSRHLAKGFEVVEYNPKPFTASKFVGFQLRCECLRYLAWDHWVRLADCSNFVAGRYRCFDLCDANFTPIKFSFDFFRLRPLFESSFVIKNPFGSAGFDCSVAKWCHPSWSCYSTACCCPWWDSSGGDPQYQAVASLGIIPGSCCFTPHREPSSTWILSSIVPEAPYYSASSCPFPAWPWLHFSYEYLLLVPSTIRLLVHSTFHPKWFRMAKNYLNYKSAAFDFLVLQHHPFAWVEPFACFCSPWAVPTGWPRSSCSAANSDWAVATTASMDFTYLVVPSSLVNSKIYYLQINNQIGKGYQPFNFFWN